MVAQHSNGGVPQSLDEAQNVQGVRSLVDQIAGEPEPVFRGIEVDLVEQPEEIVEAPLNIANRIGVARSFKSFASTEEAIQ